MIRQRNIALCIVLTFLTCGLYGVFWFYSLTEDIGLAGNDSSFTGGKAILFSIITCGIYGIFWYYKAGKLMFDAYEARGLRATDNSVLYLVLAIFGFGIIGSCILQSELNKIAIQ